MSLAYSIGTSQRDFRKRSETPGPGTYNNERSKTSLTQGKIGTQSRMDLIKKEPTPGVGSYEVRSQFDSTQYTMRPRIFTKNDNGVPGSGTYEPKIYTQFKQSVGYSMGMKYSRSEVKMKNPTPGPGTYEDNKSSIQNRPSSVFGKDKLRNYYQQKDTPGVGTYIDTGRPDSQSKPSWGFGIEQRSDFKQSQNNPGPGTYNNKDAFDPFYSRNSMGKTMNSKRSNTIDKTTPGIGTYNLNFSDKKSRPSCSIGTASRDIRNKGDQVPGSGSYNIGWVDRPSSQGVIVGSQQRKDLTETERTPGPGTYEIPNRGVGGVQLSFKGVTNKNKQHNYPGAGTYNPAIDLIKSRPKTSIIGTGQRVDFRKGQIQVGPGYYEIRGEPGDQKPKHQIGSEIQRPSSKKVGPGPGTYDIKPKFADVPKYSISKAESSKYL